MDYNLIKASLLKHEKKYEEAIELLTEFKSYRTNEMKDAKTKISVYLLLAELHDALEQSVGLFISEGDNGLCHILIKYEAGKLLEEVEEEFKDGPHEGRILLAQASSAENKGSLDQALTTLRAIEIKHGEEYFIESRMKMADIYLKYRKDRRLYAACFREILDQIPTTESYLMLGDAYMNILEPEKSIEIYEQCLKKNPRDGHLIRKVGQALVRAHFFERAVTYYKAAVRTSPENQLIKYDLAHLLFRIRRFDEALNFTRETLNRTFGSHDDPNVTSGTSSEIDSLELEAKFTFLLAQCLSRTGDTKEGIMRMLKRSHQIQNRVMRRIPIEKPDADVTEHKILAIKSVLHFV